MRGKPLQWEGRQKEKNMTIFAFITAGLMIGYLCSLIKQKEDEDE